MIDSMAIMIIAAWMLLMLRNWITYSVRRKIISEASDANGFVGIELYYQLPSYHQMMVHPAFWLKWSEADWREYLSRRVG